MKEMKEMKEKMMAQRKAEDALLTEQITKMNNAPDDKKIPLMAMVLNTMAEQRQVRMERMDKFEEARMKHMMEHMGKKGMCHCPMMGDMEGSKDMKEKKDMPEKK